MTNPALGTLLSAKAGLDIPQLAIDFSGIRAGSRISLIVSMSAISSVSDTAGNVYAQKATALISGPSDVGPYAAEVSLYQVDSFIGDSGQITIAADRVADISVAAYVTQPPTGEFVQFASAIGDLGGVDVSLPSIGITNNSVVVVGGHDRDYLRNRRTFNIGDSHFTPLKELNHIALMQGESTWAGYALGRLSYQSVGPFGTGWAVIIVELKP